MGKRYYTYIVRCADDTLYTGYTDDVPRRVALHNTGRGAKYTRGRLPVKLVYEQAFETRSEAQSYEVKIKQLSRAQKLQLLIID